MSWRAAAVRDVRLDVPAWLRAAWLTARCWRCWRWDWGYMWRWFWVEAIRQHAARRLAREHAITARLVAEKERVANRP